MADLSLELKACASKSAVDCYLDEASKIDDVEARMVKLQDSVRCLEKERQKIDAFKRELPLCMQLINHVIEKLNNELQQWQRRRTKGDTKNSTKSEKKEGEEKEMKEWSSALKLWIGSSFNSEANAETKIGKKSLAQRNESSFLESKSLNGCGAFSPFKAPAIVVKDGDKGDFDLPELSLVSPEIRNTISPTISATEDRSSGDSVGRIQIRSPSPGIVGDHLCLQAQQQGSRKTRRCWSPELHRRFVVALQQLGGAQATPKQIRELMKVDGLTNDEVKSHLQKYRLHTRKVPNCWASMAHHVAMNGGHYSPSNSP